tara:strand:- start:7586 stop:8011 length:426 start_codon:yes stop_codon:yes gene_type:complete
MISRGVNFGISEIIRFIRANDKRGWCFEGWPDDILAAYLRWYHAAGSLCLVEEDGELVALATGVQVQEKDLDKHWQVNDPAGDVLHLQDLVASKKRGVAACLDEMFSRFPKWREMKLVAVRRGQRRVMPPELFEKICMHWV